MSPDDLRFDERGLIPAVIQEADTGEVLMVAWMDRPALASTLETGLSHFWSRSRGRPWRKGETSGHAQHVDRVYADCDGDASNGCEAVLGTDNKNCGMCAKACTATQTCLGGTCSDAALSCSAIKMGNPNATSGVYLLKPDKAGWKIEDVVIDGVSTVDNFKKSFSRIIAKDGIDALIAKLKDVGAEKP